MTPSPAIRAPQHTPSPSTHQPSLVCWCFHQCYMQCCWGQPSHPYAALQALLYSCHLSVEGMAVTGTTRVSSPPAAAVLQPPSSVTCSRCFLPFYAPLIWDRSRGGDAFEQPAIFSPHMLNPTRFVFSALEAQIDVPVICSNKPSSVAPTPAW